MRAHLQATNHKKLPLHTITKILSDRVTVKTGEPNGDHGTTFKELFCVAAGELADVVHEPLENMGVLFEGIMQTGTIDKKSKGKLFSRASDNFSAIERGTSPMSFGRGQLLFIVKSASKAQATRLQAAGFSFATLTNVMYRLAQSMEVTQGELSTQLHHMQRYSVEEHMLEPGVHFGCYALRPKILGGWDILVSKDTKNLLPAVRLTENNLRQWQTDLIKGMDNMTVRECFLYLQEKMQSAAREQEIFLDEIDQTITALSARIEHPLFEHARFLARTFLIPCRTPKRSQTRGKAAVMMFRIIADAHYSSPLNGRYEFSSSRLFRAQQHVYPRSPDHGAFARQVHLEFAGLAEGRRTSSSGSRQKKPSITSSKSSSPCHPHFPNSPSTDTRRSHSETSMTCDTLLPSPRMSLPKPLTPRAFFGGIHVQKEITVDISEVEAQHENDSATEMSQFELYSQASVAPTEIDTFADELMVLLLEERRQQSAKYQNS